MNNMKLSYITVALALMLVLPGCGPMVRLHRMKPAEVDMSAMRRLAVLDFDYYRGGVDSVGDFVVGILVRSVGLDYSKDHQVSEAAYYATDELLAALRDTKYFELVDSGKLRNVNLSNTANVEKISRTLGVDAILAGDLDNIGCERENFTKEKKVYDPFKKQDVIVQVPWVRQNCSLTLSYRIIRSTGNTLVVKKSFSEYRNEKVLERNLSNLHEPKHWYLEMIDKIIPKIARQLAPYEITETRFLKVDKTHDPTMKRASALAEAGNLAQARDLFLQRWRATANPAAGYNAALLYEVEGDLENAIKLLGEIINISSDHSIVREHRRVLKALKERRRVEKQLR